MKAVYIYSRVSGLPLFDKTYEGCHDGLPLPNAVFAVYQATMMNGSKDSALVLAANNIIMIRKGDYLIGITKRSAGAFVVAVLLDNRVSRCGAEIIVQAIYENVEAQALTSGASFHAKWFNEQLVLQYLMLLRQFAAKLNRTGTVMFLLFQYEHAEKDKPKALHTEIGAASCSKKAGGVESVSTNRQASPGWMQYVMMSVLRWSPLRSQSGKHKVAPVTQSPATTTNSISGKHFETVMSRYLVLTETTEPAESSILPDTFPPVTVRDITQCLHRQPPRQPWDNGIVVEIYTYNLDTKTLERADIPAPDTCVHDPRRGGASSGADVRPAAETVSAKANSTSGIKNHSISHSNKDNSAVLQQQHAAESHLQVLFFPETRLVAVSRPSAGAFAEPHNQSSNPIPQDRIRTGSAELSDFMLWADVCLKQRLVKNVREMPVDLM